jgi:hypothetical protein
MNNTPPQCPNGHPANNNGNCFDPNCVYRNSAQNDRVDEPDAP